MKYFISLIILPLYLFGLNYQDESYPQPIVYEEYNAEYAVDSIIVDEQIIEENNFSENNYEEEIIYEYTEPQPQNPQINYMELKQARKEAIEEHKYVLVKIESSNCPTCMKLNQLLETNEHIKGLFNNYIKAVKLNLSYDKVPPKYQFIGTPTIFLIEPNRGKIQVELQGSDAINDLELALEEAAQDLS
jgi:thioredoxin-related protein